MRIQLVKQNILYPSELNPQVFDKIRAANQRVAGKSSDEQRLVAGDHDGQAPEGLIFVSPAIRTRLLATGASCGRSGCSPLLLSDHAAQISDGQRQSMLAASVEPWPSFQIPVAPHKSHNRASNHAHGGADGMAESAHDDDEREPGQLDDFQKHLRKKFLSKMGEL